MSDPGSVHPGGAIEVFSGTDAARTRAACPRASAFPSPAPTEHARLKGRFVLRLSPYPTENAADAYAAPLDAAEVVRLAPGRNTADT